MNPQKTAKYCVDLHKRNTENLGFIPAQRIVQYAESGQILLETDNGELCGYLIFGNGVTTRIYQACIDYDVRRRRHGLNLVSRLIAIAQNRDSEGIMLRCRETLPANMFWRDAGFACINKIQGGARRNKMLNVWYRHLWPVLFLDDLNADEAVIRESGLL